jgi:hypothetical protein
LIGKFYIHSYAGIVNLTNIESAPKSRKTSPQPSSNGEGVPLLLQGEGVEVLLEFS